MSKPRNITERAALADAEVQRRIIGDSTQARRNQARLAGAPTSMHPAGCPCLYHTAQRAAGWKAFLADAMHDALRLLILNGEINGNDQRVQDAMTILSEALASLPQE